MADVQVAPSSASEASVAAAPRTSASSSAISARHNDANLMSEASADCSTMRGRSSRAVGGLRSAEGTGSDQVGDRHRGLALDPLGLGQPCRAWRGAPLPQPLGGVPISADRGRRGGDDRELGRVEHDLLGKPVDQTVGRVLTREHRLQPAAHHELAEDGPVLRGPRVVLGRHDHVPRAVPVGRPPVERTAELGVVVPEPRPQERGEERVIAVQRLTVDLGEEDPPTFEIGQPRAGIDVVAQRDGQVGGQLVHDAGPLEEPLDRLVLAFEHLGEQVLRHGLLCGATIEREAPGVRALLDRVGDQPEAGRPTLGPFVDGEDIALGEVQPVRLEELGGLGEPEEEVRVPDLAQAALHAEPTDPQRRIGAAGDEQLELLGSPLDQPAERGDRAGGGQLVDVVEHEHRAVPGERQLVERVVEHREVAVTAAAVAGGERADPAERIEDRSDETTRQVVARLDGQPCGRYVVGAADPSGEQRGLPGTRRCRHQRHLATPALGQQLVQAGSGHDGLGQPRHPRPRCGQRRAQDHGRPSSLKLDDAMCPAGGATVGRPRPSGITPYEVIPGLTHAGEARQGQRRSPRTRARATAPSRELTSSLR